MKPPAYLERAERDPFRTADADVRDTVLWLFVVALVVGLLFVADSCAGTAACAAVPALATLHRPTLPRRFIGPLAMLVALLKTLNPARP